MIKQADNLNKIQEYYFSQKLREVNKLIAEGKPIINLGIGSPDLLPPPAVIDALKNSLNDAGANKYQSYQGLPELREAMRKFYFDYYAVSVDASHEILPLMGSKEGIFHISKAFLNPGDEALIPNPGYPTYTSVTHLAGAIPVYYDLTEKNNWFPDLEALEKSDLSGVKLMWTSYPHMPTGALATKKDLQKLVEFAQKHKILLVNDNPYSFILNNHPVSILACEGAREVAIELNSLSKTFNMAGWRVGMVLGTQKYIEPILKVKSNMDSGMFYGIQKGAIEALMTPISWIETQNKTYEKRREWVWKIAEALTCTFDKNASGLFVWAKHPKQQETLRLVDELLYEKDVFVAPGTIFGSGGAGYIRFSLCVPEDQLKEVYKRVVVKRIRL